MVIWLFYKQPVQVASARRVGGYYCFFGPLWYNASAEQAREYSRVVAIHTESENEQNTRKAWDIKS